MKVIKRFYNWLRWHLYWKYEAKRCRDDPHYFYTKYIRINGQPATTSMSKVIFNDIFNQVKNSSETSKFTLYQRRYEYRSKIIS